MKVISNPLAWMGAGVAIFLLGLLVGMAMQRAAFKHAQDHTEEDLTDWEGDSDG